MFLLQLVGGIKKYILLCVRFRVLERILGVIVIIFRLVDRIQCVFLAVKIFFRMYLVFLRQLRQSDMIMNKFMGKRNVRMKSQRFIMGEVYVSWLGVYLCVGSVGGKVFLEFLLWFFYCRFQMIFSDFMEVCLLREGTWYETRQ